MGRNLTLCVPESDRRSDFIRQFYDFSLAKSEQYNHPKIDYSQHLRDRRDREIARLETDGRFHIWLNVPRDFRWSSSWERLRDLAETDREPRLVEGDELDKMISILRDIKQDLKKAQQRGELSNNTYTPERWEVEMELGQIAMCEFAREHGYGVKLTY